MPTLIHQFFPQQRLCNHPSGHSAFKLKVFPELSLLLTSAPILWPMASSLFFMLAELFLPRVLCICHDYLCLEKSPSFFPQSVMADSFWSFWHQLKSHLIRQSSFLYVSCVLLPSINSPVYFSNYLYLFINYFNFLTRFRSSMRSWTSSVWFFLCLMERLACNRCWVSRWRNE